jgi:hypothetical protein
MLDGAAVISPLFVMLIVADRTTLNGFPTVQLSTSITSGSETLFVTLTSAPEHFAGPNSA